MAQDTLEIIEEHPTSQELLARIASSERGWINLKIRTLMEKFGYTANHRLRQSSLQEVLDHLEVWGITYQFPNGVSVSDTITLRRAPVVPKAPTVPPKRPGTSAHRSKNLEPLNLGLGSNPFFFVFDVGDVPERERERSISLCQDIFNAIWSSRPVCLFLDCSDEFFSFASGYLSAVLRRRALMLRRGSIPQAPEVLPLQTIKGLLGQLEESWAQQHRESFPADGSVYLIRDVPDDVEGDDRVASVREMFIPHTYRLRARFTTTTADPGSGKRRASKERGFAQVLEWISAYGGVRSLESRLASDELLDLASLFAEASQLRETLLDREAFTVTDRDFRAGFESTEHMLLKGAMLKFLRETQPEAKILVESFIEDEEEDGEEATDTSPRSKPDLRIADKLWIEVETLRGLVRQGSNPFFSLETKLRPKLSNMKAKEELWLVVPSDIAFLATAQISAVVRNLRATLPGKGHRIHLAFPDLYAGRPVFYEPVAPPTGEIKLSGASWRDSKKVIEEKSLNWDDVAGYSDLQERLKGDVLAPLRDPERYARYGVSAPNGLLLYGLPGCGKSLIGRVLAGEADLICRRILPSDLSSMWIGEGVAKIRELFDWALKQPACLLILDELDAVAPQRKEHNMHTDEKRQVNELLSQFDRIKGKPVTIVATTNYIDGIDTAIRRSGRFDVKIPVFPPSQEDREAIFRHYLDSGRLHEVKGVPRIDYARLAELSPLYTPADIKAVVDTALRRAIFNAGEESHPRLSTKASLDVMQKHPRSISRAAAVEWLEGVRQELGPGEDGPAWLEEEIERAYPQD